MDCYVQNEHSASAARIRANGWNDEIICIGNLCPAPGKTTETRAWFVRPPPAGLVLRSRPADTNFSASLTHSGTGIVRMWPPFPLRSAMTQWPSRSWRSSNLKVVTSALRRPQPMRSESKARFRRLRRVSPFSAASNFLPSSAVSQFPIRTPSRRTPLTRRMAAARSGLRSPQSDAS
jgi:hypothetical protein